MIFVISSNNGGGDMQEMLVNWGERRYWRKQSKALHMLCVRTTEKLGRKVIVWKDWHCYQRMGLCFKKIWKAARISQPIVGCDRTTRSGSMVVMTKIVKNSNDKKCIDSIDCEETLVGGWIMIMILIVSWFC